MQAEVVYLFAFDVANEIKTEKVSQVLNQAPTRYEIRMEQASPRYAPLYRPLAVELPPPEVKGPAQATRLLVRVYEVGVLTVALHLVVPYERLLDLNPYHQPPTVGGQPFDAVARGLRDRICEDLRPFLVRETAAIDPEDYTAFCLSEFPGVSDVNCWLAEHRREVAGLLTQTDPALLSEVQVNEALRLQRSFQITDLVVVDWDAALVIDLTGYVEDVLYVLELANLQLEEFRVMDLTLDRYLDQAYDHLERSRLTLFGTSARILRRLRAFRVDATKLADEVTHITKFLGDWYLARVYLAARERFYLDQWRGSVEHRLTQLDQLYSVLHGETNERRMLWLEVIIVVLFLIDVAVLFLGKK